MPKSILVVDDNRLSRELLRVILELENCIVEEVAGGIEALTRLKSGPGFDLIFMDCSMPRMDGVQAAKEILRLSPNTRLIGMSASGEGRREECLAAGMVEYIRKPFNRMKIQELLMKFDGSSVSSEPSASL